MSSAQYTEKEKEEKKTKKKKMKKKKKEKKRTKKKVRTWFVEGGARLAALGPYGSLLADA